jgi:DNA-binding transcriptional MerR regulator
MLRIGEVATRTGLSLRTLRHWDQVGLVVPHERSDGNFRLYSEEDVELILFVKTLKPLELSLEQIHDLVDLLRRARSDGDDENDMQDVIARLNLFRAAADARIEALHAHLRGLESLSSELRSLTAEWTRPPRRAVNAP